MQRSTDKQLTVRGELAELLKETIQYHNLCDAARASVANAQELSMWLGWQAGMRLNAMKALVGSGDWQDWLEFNFCKPRGIALRTAQVYMRIDNENASLRQKAKTQRVAPNKADLQLLKRLKFDTVRKYAIQFVPEKHQPEHKGNVKFPRLVSFVNIGNEYNRLKYRHTNDLQQADFDLAREETKEMVPTILWLHRDYIRELLSLSDDQFELISANPWDALTATEKAAR